MILNKTRAFSYSLACFYAPSKAPVVSKIRSSQGHLHNFLSHPYLTLTSTPAWNSLISWEMQTYWTSVCMLLEWNNTRNYIEVNNKNIKYFSYLLSMTFLMKFFISVLVTNAKPVFFSTSGNVTGSSLTEFGSYVSQNSILTEKPSTSSFSPDISYLQWILVKSRKDHYK